MPVMLIAEDEKLVWKHDETNSGLYYRRPTVQVQREIQAKYTVQGRTDTNAVIDELLVWVVTGWFGIVNQHGMEVAYDAKHLSALPELYKAAFISQMYALMPEVAELGN